jgi:hypothetical protein
VIELESMSQKGDPIRSIGGVGSVRLVPQNRVTDRGHLRSDLVFSTGFEVDFEQTLVRFGSKNLITQGASLSLGRWLFQNLAPISRAHQPAFQASLGAGRAAFDHGPVSFAYGSSSDLVGKS